ncbi:HDOD domain-containing protein [Glaciecola sp. 1036]|uniref:HDOD domain-containing protein n=1 Tax=Alteromonadaceae TaxID=72275 RepID=UPI003CFFD4A3
MSLEPIVKFASKSFTLPDTCTKLRTMLDDPRASVDDIARIMSVDPSLSAKVLRLANSALFRFQNQITTVPKALGVIGGEAAYNISMAETANLAFKSFASEAIDFNQFWEKAVLGGLIAKSIAQQRQIRGSDRYFVIGILHNLSELICATRLPEKYLKYKDLLDEYPPLEAQMTVFNFTFAHCSGLILKNWQIPESIYEALLKFSLSEDSLGNFDCAVVYASSGMAHYNLGADFIHQSSTPEILIDTIGLTDDEYDIISEFARVESLKIASALN